MSLGLKKFNFPILSLFPLLPATFLIDHVSYAKSYEAYVYCVKEDKKWKWLIDKYGNYVKVLGQEDMKMNSKYSFDPILRHTTKFIKIEYFQIEEDASNKIKKFQRQCMDLYGNDYKYAQPAYDRFTGWMPFATDNGELAQGFYKVRMELRQHKRSEEPSISWKKMYIELNPDSNRVFDRLLDEKIVQVTDLEVSLRRNASRNS